MNRYTTFARDITQYYYERLCVGRRFPKYALMFHDINENPERWYDADYAIRATSLVDLVDSIRRQAPQMRFLTAEEFAFDSNAQGILLTFDDAFRGVYESAYPVLLERQIPFIAFQCTQNLDDTAYLSCDMIREMLQYEGFELGSHTLTHRKLSTLTTDESRQEISQSKEILEETFGREVRAIAYPYGSSSAVLGRDRKAAQVAGYQMGYATIASGYSSGSRYNIPRLNVNESNYRDVIARICQQ